MRIIYFIITTFMISGCSVYTISGNTGVYVKFSGNVLPHYQTTVIVGNTTTDYRHVAKVEIRSKTGKIKKTKADNKGAYLIKVKHPGVYNIRAEFTKEVFVETEIVVKEGELHTVIDLVVQ